MTKKVIEVPMMPTQWKQGYDGQKVGWKGQSLRSWLGSENARDRPVTRHVVEAAMMEKPQTATHNLERSPQGSEMARKA